MEKVKRYNGRRFAAFLISTLLLTVGLFAGVAESFPSFATTLGMIYGAYVTGQSATDWKEASNGA